jgi:hypothetical protein
VEVNRSGKCKGPSGGDRRGALCTEFTLVIEISKGNHYVIVEGRRS